jgi:hypothetical protein
MTAVHTQPLQTWAVVATVDEPAVLVAAFARHHLAIGASEVHLYLDRPHPDLAPLIAGLAGCFVTLCDDAYWAQKRNGDRPERHTGRQKFNANDAFETSTCDWVLHCDADEFVEDGDVLQSELQDAPESRQFIRLPNVERVHAAGEAGAHVFEGIYRRPNTVYAEVGDQIYGRFAKFLRKGLTGHIAGKSIVRTSAPAQMGIHFPANSEGDTSLTHKKSRKARILHFDGLTPLHFGIKLMFRATHVYSGPPPPRGEQRDAQIRFVRNNIGRPKEVLRLVHGVHFLDKNQIEQLDALGQIHELAFVPKGCADLDISIEAFDAALKEVHASLLQKTGLQLPQSDCA